MAAAKIITAVVSYATAIAVYRLIPLALKIPSPVQLEREIHERRAAQGKLQSRYERSVIANRVTRDIRRNLQLSAICSATAEHCATLFNADLCTLYRYKRKTPTPSPSTDRREPVDEKDSQCQEEDSPCAATSSSSQTIEAASWPRENDHSYSVLSKFYKAEGNAGDAGPESPVLQDNSSLQQAPPLHLLP
jgi:hypothetical protein